MECNEDNRGKMNYDTFLLNGTQTDVIGFCIKQGESFKWMYLSGATNLTAGNTSIFGQ